MYWLSKFYIVSEPAQGCMLKFCKMQQKKNKFEKGKETLMYNLRIEHSLTK